MSGFLITIEGIGGSGKTTLAASLAAWLTSNSVPMVSTREPGATPAGKMIRELVLSTEEPLTPITETFLFEADRSEAYAKVIVPALAKGAVVIADRNLYGTIAYQAFGGGVDVALVDGFSAAALGGTYPDLVLVLDLPTEVAAGRLARQGGGDRFDRRGSDFLERVRAGYRFAAERDGSRARLVDASRPANEVLSEGKKHVVELLRSTYPNLSIHHKAQDDGV